MEIIYAQIADPKKDVEAPRELIFDKALKDGSVRFLLLALTLMLNPRWQLTVSGIASLMGRTARQAKRYVKDLRDHGYLVIDKHKDPKTGRWDGWSWTIYRRGLAVHLRKKELPLWRATA